MALRDTLLGLVGRKPQAAMSGSAYPTANPAGFGFRMGAGGAGVGMPPGLEAGSHTRRLWAWRPGAEHVNSLLAAAGDTVLARARWLNRNNPYAKAAMRSWRGATVGAGIKPSSLVEVESTREAINKAWLDFTDEADAEGITDLYGLQRRVAAEVFLAGECFVRLRPRLPSDGLVVPLQLQLLPAEQLPLWNSKHENIAPSGGSVRLGIEFDPVLRDKRVAYWFKRGNTQDATLSFREAIIANQVVRVPAEFVIHVFDPGESGQIRGLSSYGAAMVRIFHLDLLDDAMLEKAKQAARFSAVIKSAGDENMAVQSALDDIPIAPYGPGAYIQLNPGEDIEFSPNMDVGGSYEPFQYRNLLAICAALGIPYHELSGDLSKANYSSQRAGLLAFRNDVEAFQHSTLIFQFLRRVWQVWMDTAVIAGALPISAAEYERNKADFRRAKFIPPKMPWVDPWKDGKAEALMVAEGFKSRGDVVESLGEDVEQLDQRIAEDREREKRLGLQFPVAPPVADGSSLIDSENQTSGDRPPGSEAAA